MPNYREVEVLLRESKPFTHSRSMRARISGDEYLVYSYDTLIAWRKLDTGEAWLSPAKHSRTTTRQQNIIRDAWDL